MNIIRFLVLIVAALLIVGAIQAMAIEKDIFKGLLLCMLSSVVSLFGLCLERHLRTKHLQEAPVEKKRISVDELYGREEDEQ